MGFFERDIGKDMDWRFPQSDLDNFDPNCIVIGKNI